MAIWTWHTCVDGEQYDVELYCPYTGHKTIYVNNEEVGLVGSAMTMYANWPVEIGGREATIRFRAIKHMRGATLLLDDQKIIPARTDGMRAETVQIFLFAVPTLILAVLALQLFFG